MRRSTAAALLRAARPLAHGNIAPPILYGQALALALTGRFTWTGFALAHAFGLVDHLLVVFANDYADKDDDARNDSPTPFSGGSRVLPDGELSPGTIGALAIGSLSLLAALSVAAYPAAHALPLLALAAIALIGGYSYPPLRLSHRGGGELLQGLGVGVVLPLVGVAAQGAALEPRVLVCLAPTFVLGVAGNVLTSIPDERADRAAAKRSPAARWGGPAARRVSVALHLAAIALGTAMVPTALTPRLVVAAAAAVPQALALARRDTSPLAFVVLGGLSETIALVGWSAALALA